MRFNLALNAAALLCAASLSVPAGAQDVPTPPPAGVKPVPRRGAPVETRPAVVTPPAAQAQPAPNAQPESLPQIPENPIRLEDQKALQDPAMTPMPVPAQTPVAMPLEQQPVVVPVQQPVGVPPVAVEAAAANRRPVKPKGPVYYYPVDPYTFPANVNTPPAMHLPNSPFVEDLSVAGDHGRYTYYSYRRPWYTPGHQSANVTIVW